jgi:hypothetical protein
LLRSIVWPWASKGHLDLLNRGIALLMIGVGGVRSGSGRRPADPPRAVQQVRASVERSQRPDLTRVVLQRTPVSRPKDFCTRVYLVSDQRARAYHCRVLRGGARRPGAVATAVTAAGLGCWPRRGSPRASRESRHQAVAHDRASVLVSRLSSTARCRTSRSSNL